MNIAGQLSKRAISVLDFGPEKVTRLSVWQGKDSRRAGDDVEFAIAGEIGNRDALRTSKGDVTFGGAKGAAPSVDEHFHRTRIRDDDLGVLWEHFVLNG